MTADAGSTDPKLSRRDFMLSAGAAGAMGAGLAMAGRWAWKSRVRSRSADIVVIGAGNAGLSAAVTAAELGKTVAVIEKNDRLGLNIYSDRGIFASSVGPDGSPVPGDSVERHFEDTMRGGRFAADPELVRVFVQEAAEALPWLHRMGMEFMPDPIFSASGYPRCWSPAWAGYTEILYRRARELGVEVVFGERLTGFVERRGRIAGAMTESAFGGRSRWSARAGVILATGGFAANPELVARYAPEYSGIPNDNQPGATGEAARLAIEAGAAAVGMGEIQCLPRPPGDTQTQGYLHLDTARFIYVDSSGKRFIAETSPRDEVTRAFLGKKDGAFFEIADNDAVLSYQADIQKDLWKQIETGTAFKADTVRELAEVAGLPPAALEKTVRDYNAGVAKKTDALGKLPSALTHTISKPPFWAAKVVMMVHETLGGLRTSAKAEVLRGDGTPIPGLWAAGAATGGIHGKNKLGGNGIASAIAFGRIAGRSASEAVP